MCFAHRTIPPRPSGRGVPRDNVKILVVTPTYAENPTSGGVLVTHERIEQLRQVGEVTVLCVHADSANPVIGLIKAGHLKPRTPSVLLGSYINREPLSVWRNHTKALLNAADSLASESWDLVYCDHWLMWPAASRVPAKKRVLHLHNAEHVLFARAAAHLPRLSSMLANIEAHRVQRYLQRACQAADEVHLLSSADAQILANDAILGDTPTLVFTPACERKHFEQANAAGRQGALTVGSLSWEPTRLGLTWFMREVRSGIQDLPLTVIGKGAPASLTLMLANDPAVTALGFIDDLDPYYARAKCFIAPLLDGSGIKIKILNALARGIPVVTTPVGIEGFPAGFESCVQVAYTPQSFAEQVARVEALSDAEWEDLSRKGQHYVQTHFSGAAWAQWCTNL